MKHMKIIITLLVSITSFNVLASDKKKEEGQKFYQEFKKIDNKYPEGKEKYKALEKCAKHGNYVCSGMVGLYYYFIKDYNKAYKHLQFAAQEGRGVYSIYNALGDMYLSGKGVLQDNDKGIYYLKKSITNSGREQDKAKTSYNISTGYAHKQFTIENSISSYAWLKIAQSLGMETVFPDEPIEAALNRQAIYLGSTNKTKADKLAKKICSTIEGCNSGDE
jgi:TPR repeat protein